MKLGSEGLVKRLVDGFIGQIIGQIRDGTF
jgi:hypothetical protein